MKCRFVEKPFEWLAIIGKYELGVTFPIHTGNTKLTTYQFQRTIETVRSNLAASEILIEQAMVNNNLKLENYVRGNYQRKDQKTASKNVLSASILLSVKCQFASSQLKVRLFNGTLLFAGVISSRIWCNKSNTMADVKRYLSEGIIRSLTTRILIYCEALRDTLVSNDAVFVSKPQRHVFFNLPTYDEAMHPIQFSEYIFRGEDPTVAISQAKHVLDLDINAAALEAKLETVLDNKDLHGDSIADMSGLDVSAGDAPTWKPTSAADLTRNMYLSGIIAVLIAVFITKLFDFLLK